MKENWVEEEYDLDFRFVKMMIGCELGPQVIS